MTTARAVYQTLAVKGRRPLRRGVRLHVIREDDDPSSRRPWCGRNGGTIVIDPMPAEPPEGMTWCPECVGLLAGRYGLLGDIAESLAAYDRDLYFYDGRDERWARRRAANAALATVRLTILLAFLPAGVPVPDLRDVLAGELRGPADRGRPQFPFPVPGERGGILEPGPDLFDELLMSVLGRDVVRVVFGTGFRDASQPVSRSHTIIMPQRASRGKYAPRLRQAD